MNKLDRFLCFFFSLISLLYIKQISDTVLLCKIHNSFSRLTYFWGAKIFPLILIIPFLYFHEKKNSRIKKTISIIYILLIVIVLIALILLITAFFLDIPFEVFTGMDWSYSGSISWATAIIASFLLSFHKTKDILTSFTLACLSMWAGGFLYEIPYYPGMTGYEPFHYWHPLFIATTIVCVPLLAYVLHKLKWKPNKTFLSALIFWGIFTITIIIRNTDTLFGTHTDLANWVPRLPTILLMLTLPSGLEGAKNLG